MSSDVKLKINSFGGFSITAEGPSGESVVSDGQGRAKKPWPLIEYLIFSDKEEVSNSELIEMLWPDGGADDPVASLRLVVYRARNELSRLKDVDGTSLIVSFGEAYGWNRDIPFETDTAVFEELHDRALAAGGDERIRLLLEAAAVYRGHFIPKMLHMHWAMALDAYFHSKYIAVCTMAAELLCAGERWQEVIALCRSALELEPYSDELNAALVRALDASGLSAAALEHYERISRMMLAELGVASTEKLSAAYRAISKNSQAPETNIGSIRDELAENEADGAYYCGYELFRQIYHFKARECSRTGQLIQLAMLTLVPAKQHTPGERAKNSAMERLGEVIRESLRIGDAYSQLSSSQYVILLQSTDYENGKRVLERVTNNFRRAAPRSEFLVQHSLVPMLPAESES